MNKRITIAAVVVAVIAVAALAYNMYGNQLLGETNSNTTAQPEIASNTNMGDVSNDDSQRKIETLKFVSNYKDNAPLDFDGKIVSINAYSGTETVIVPSIKNAYPELKQAFNWTLQQVSQSEDKGYLYFTKVLMETDAPPADLIRFDGNTKKFTKLSVSSYFYGYGTASASKTSPWAASVVNPQSESDEQSLYLLDLDRDTAKLVIKLPAGQTFNFCHDGGCLGGKIGNIEWLSGTQYQVGIYSTIETEKDQYGSIQRKLIEKRKFNIN